LYRYAAVADAADETDMSGTGGPKRKIDEALNVGVVDAAYADADAAAPPAKEAKRAATDGATSEEPTSTPA
jgi:hypothetical protein